MPGLPAPSCPHAVYSSHVTPHVLRFHVFRSSRLHVSRSRSHLFNSSNVPTLGSGPTSGAAYALNATVMLLPPSIYDGSMCLVSRATVLKGVRKVSIEYPSPSLRRM